MFFQKKDDDMRIANTIQDSIVDGPGLRFTVFTQGCPHHCVGCHNPETHDPNGGKEVTVEELAAAFKAQNDLGMKGGMLVTNPIPEEYAMPLETINAAIDQAIAECEEKGIHGKETTPFLLARVAEITGGNSLASNIQLVYNNAKIAAQTAAVYATL